MDINEKSLADLPESSRRKYELLAQRFRANFGQEPTFFTRAPGRVNLIGEHIDYCGYSVLPMAIEHDIVIAASLNSTATLNLTNYEDQFREQTIDVKDFSIDKSKPKWHDYFLSGFKGILEKFKIENPTGINVCLFGQVPKSAGLSSSSALVVCAALCTVYANKIQISKTELAETCAIAERYVGTQGGGMDQAISCLAEAGCAKLIDFNPLKVTNVVLPSGSLFVITNSCVEANKAATNHFNTRVVECRLSSQILAKKNGVDWRQIKKPLELQKALSKSLLELIELVRTQLHPEAYTLEEICQILETNHDELMQTTLTPNTSELKEFQLHSRALHVFTEAQRVYDFRDTCSNASESALTQLGQLMNDSHESCKSSYDCSCPELDELTDICRSSGAYGSRLTGAGWGGCAVSLIPEAKLDEFLASVKQLYYSKTERLAGLYEQAAFSTKPADGIGIFLP